MKKLTSSDSIITINHYKNVLKSEGIASEIRNEHLSTIFGEVPFMEIWPELWVKNDLDFDRAQQLIELVTSDESSGESWRCRKCGEDNEGQFSACWNCSTASD